MAAVRSYIMVAIVFAAIILNRPALSQRNLAIAALLILIVMPQSLTDAGFQMSFAATAALIAYFESRAPVRRLSSWPAFIALPVTFLFADVVTTLLAGAAVDPFSAYHFHRIAVYSVLGNLAAMPAVSFIVMPMVMLALVAMPFGLEAVPLLIMKQGIEAMLAIAAAVAALPGAVIAVPAFSGVAFALIIIGGCWLIIWRGRWRYFGLAAIGLGLAVAPFRVAPDIWVEREGNLVAIRDAKGLIATAEGRKATFSLERWMEADGDLRPVKAARGSKSFQCDGQSCIALVKGKLVSHVTHPSAYADDCRRAAILIVNFTPPERCTQPEIVIDLSDLREKGAHTLRISEQGMEMRTVAGERGRRPWSVYVARRETIPAVAPDKEPPSKGEEEKSGARKRREPCRSIAADEAHQLALNANAVRPEDPRFIGRIGGLQSDRLSFAAEAFQCRFLIIDQGNDDVAIGGGVGLLDDDRVAIENAGLDHRIALYLKGEMLARRENIFGYVDRMAVIFDRRARHARRDAPHHRYAHPIAAIPGIFAEALLAAAFDDRGGKARIAPVAEARLNAFGHFDDFQGPRPVRQTADEAALLKSGNQSVNARFRPQIERFLHFVIGWRHAGFLESFIDEEKKFLLRGGEHVFLKMNLVRWQRP